MFMLGIVAGLIVGFVTAMYYTLAIDKGIWNESEKIVRKRKIVTTLVMCGGIINGYLLGLFLFLFLSNIGS